MLVYGHYFKLKTTKTHQGEQISEQIYLMYPIIKMASYLLYYNNNYTIVQS